MFYCEFCEISKNTCFTEHLWATASEFVTEMLIFRSSRSQKFFKISVLKNFAILFLIIKLPSFTGHLRWLFLNFCDSKYFFPAEHGIHCLQSQRLLFWTPLKTRVKPQKCHWSCFIKCKRSLLRKFPNFIGKQLCWSLFLIELQIFRLATLEIYLLERDSNTDVFLWNLLSF